MTGTHWWGSGFLEGYLPGDPGLVRPRDWRALPAVWLEAVPKQP